MNSDIDVERAEQRSRILKGFCEDKRSAGKPITSFELETLVDELCRLRGIISDVASSGVEFDDPRLDYVTVQIDRETWDAARASA